MSCSNLLDIIDLLLDVKPSFQSIASHKGSQQKLHSDAIHMTTNPLVWLQHGLPLRIFQ